MSILNLFWFQIKFQIDEAKEMKKSLKRTFVSFGVIIGVIVILFGALVFKLYSEMKHMTPLPTRLITDGIYAINDKSVNFYIIRDKNNLVAIDAGNDAKNIKRELEELKLDPEKISAVFLTHSDRDHIAGVELFKNAKIYISSSEEQMINSTTPRFLIFKNKLNANHEDLNDNGEITSGNLKIKSILTPGHTPGSMSYLVNGRYLFTGDTLSLKNGHVDLFVHFFNMDDDLERKSITQIKALAHKDIIKYVFTAHHGYTDNTLKAFENWK
jgi:hydroxyacylglutathione hydrolase